MGIEVQRDSSVHVSSSARSRSPYPDLHVSALRQTPAAFIQEPRLPRFLTVPLPCDEAGSHRAPCCTEVAISEVGGVQHSPAGAPEAAQAGGAAAAAAAIDFDLDSPSTELPRD